MATDELRDFSADEFAEWLPRECIENNGLVDLGEKGMTDESMVQLAGGLLKAFGYPVDGDGDDDHSPMQLKKLDLYGNDFGSAGLGALAEVLSRLPCCSETLVLLHIGGNPKVTTLAPLAAASVLEGLKELFANSCSLSGDEGVLPPELCANLPALEELHLSRNAGGATVTLTAEALCALPAECRVVLRNTKVQVARPSAEDGDMGLVLLPTAAGEEFGAFLREEFGPSVASSAKTVLEICAFTGVQRMTLVKPARA